MEILCCNERIHTILSLCRFSSCEIFRSNLKNALSLSSLSMVRNAAPAPAQGRKRPVEEDWEREVEEELIAEGRITRSVSGKLRKLQEEAEEEEEEDEDEEEEGPVASTSRLSPAVEEEQEEKEIEEDEEDEEFDSEIEREATEDVEDVDEDAVDQVSRYDSRNRMRKPSLISR